MGRVLDKRHDSRSRPNPSKKNQKRKLNNWDPVRMEKAINEFHEGKLSLRQKRKLGPTIGLQMSPPLATSVVLSRTVKPTRNSHSLGYNAAAVFCGATSHVGR